MLLSKISAAPSTPPPRLTPLSSLSSWESTRLLMARIMSLPMSRVGYRLGFTVCARWFRMRITLLCRCPLLNVVHRMIANISPSDRELMPTPTTKTPSPMPARTLIRLPPRRKPVPPRRLRLPPRRRHRPLPIPVPQTKAAGAAGRELKAPTKVPRREGVGTVEPRLGL